MKRCSRCGGRKALIEFYKNRTMRDGHASQCISCVKEQRAEYRRKNKDKLRKQHQQSYLRNREKRLANARDYYLRNPHINHESVLRYRERNPEKTIARRRVNDAIKLGKLKPKPCERCGQAVGVQAHHEDYSKPLDVNWLCPPCHGQRHREINEERRRAS